MDGENGNQLQQIFHRLRSLIDDMENYKIERMQLPAAVQDAIVTTLKAIRYCNDLALFSRNETVEDVASSDIKYLLLPAYLAYFYSQKMDMDTRLEALGQSIQFYEDFLRTCRALQIISSSVYTMAEDAEDTDENSDGAGKKLSEVNSLVAASRQRDDRIARRREEKQRKARMKVLEEQMRTQTVDQDVLREYYLEDVRSWCNQAVENIDIYKREVCLLDSRKPATDSVAAHSADGRSAPRSSDKVELEKGPAPLRPFVLVRTELMKKVFGAGYPSLPTYSIEEWYDMQVEQGLLPKPGSPPAQKQVDERREKEQRDAEKEAKVERDDQAALDKQRKWDDWKDDHRRGEGNRQNMG